MAVTAEVVTITPKEAALILTKNTNNRNLRKSRITTYARDMAAGNWKLNGDPIRFNGKGNLIDGQHRLHACVLANKPFTTLRVTGVSVDAHHTIDVGLQRTMADELRWQGQTHAAELAAILALIWGYDNGGDWFSVPSRSDLRLVLEKNPSVRESLAAIAVGRKLAIRPTALCASHFLMAREHGREMADRFLASVASGADLAEGDPVLVLRNYAMNVAGSRLHRPNTQEWLAICIKAINSWLLGRQLKQLRWRRVGPGAEKFPHIISSEDVEEM